MARAFAHLAFLVRDYDEAIAWFTTVLRFELVEDTRMSADKRWVVIAPARGAATTLLLAKAATDEQRQRIGDQTGGRVFLFLDTDDFDGEYRHLQAHGVAFQGEPRDEPYGRVVVFTDLYGNKWDLVQRRR